MSSHTDTHNNNTNTYTNNIKEFSDEQVFVGRMKDLTCGEKIYARKLFNGVNYDKINLIPICNTNFDEEVIWYNLKDEGQWKRIKVTPFSSKFTDNV